MFNNGNLVNFFCVPNPWVDVVLYKCFNLYVGISHNDEVETASIMPFVQEALDGIEFARGDANSTWGSVRASMGRQEPFELKYVAIGNEDCGKTYYRGFFTSLYDYI